jgi:hypothetical protein
MTAHAIVPSAQLATPETYLNSDRAQGFAVPLRAGIHSYPGLASPGLNEFALQGSWNVGSQSSTPVSSGASITVGFQAQNVYLVMTSAGNLPRHVRVLLDGHPYTTITVSGQRLYSLVSLPRVEQRVLTVQVPRGVSAYSFTFG